MPDPIDPSLISQTRYQKIIPGNQNFARTNLQTIYQRASLMRELLPNINSIAEICCGDCKKQYAVYTTELGVERFRCLDIDAKVAEQNKKAGIDCICADALNKDALKNFLDCEAVFFGPPLSKNCDGHHLLAFSEITPGYFNFCDLLLGDLCFNGTLVCICPRITSHGNISMLYRHIKNLRGDFGLRLIHHSYSTITGHDEPTELRLKYVELWFSNVLEDQWQVRESTIGRD